MRPAKIQIADSLRIRTAQPVQNFHLTYFV